MKNNVSFIAFSLAEGLIGISEILKISDKNCVKSRLRTPISTKLTLGTVVLILAVVTPITFRNSQLFESTFGKSQYDANAELANAKSVEIDTAIYKYLEKIRLLTKILVQETTPTEQNGLLKIKESIIESDLDLVNIAIYDLKTGKPQVIKQEINEVHLKSYDQDVSYIEKLRKDKPINIMELFADKEKILIRGSSIQGGIPMITLGVPFADQNGIVNYVTLADMRLDRLQKGFSLDGVRMLYLVDSSGSILTHSEESIAITSKNYSHIPIVQEALSKGTLGSKGQKRFFDPDAKQWFVAAYSKTGFGPTVIVQAPEEIILEPAQALRRSTIEIALYSLFVALFFVFVFSYSITSPIEKLHGVTMEIAKGNFLVKAEAGSGDEVADLAQGFNEMVEGLKERDKAKNLLNKFHGSSITEDMLKRNTELGGVKKEVTVLFSDIRDFTKFSEGHTPEEVVAMLNEYFQVMVSIITAYGGIVDKFVGDAIMAVWGAPNSTGADSFNAAKACIKMRISLNELNEKRLKRGQTAIKIGVGLHAGPAISGTIGSTERMEYTVIGDTVNMASRIESSTKAFGTDFLVSETVAEQINSRIILEYAGAAEVKGKAEPIKMYKVRGFINNKGESVFVQTPYSDYEAGHVDKVKVS